MIFKKNLAITIITITVFFAITGFSTHSLLQGRWMSNEDPKSILAITNTKYIEIYNSRKISSENYYRNNHSCDSAYLKNSNPQNVDFISLEGGRCFEILSLTTGHLTLKYTVSGKILTFHKLKRR